MALPSIQEHLRHLFCVFEAKRNDLLPPFPPPCMILFESKTFAHGICNRRQNKLRNFVQNDVLLSFLKLLPYGYLHPSTPYPCQVVCAQQQTQLWVGERGRGGGGGELGADRVCYFPKTITPSSDSVSTILSPIVELWVKYSLYLIHCICICIRFGTCEVRRLNQCQTFVVLFDWCSGRRRFIYRANVPGRA